MKRRIRPCAHPRLALLTAVLFSGGSLALADSWNTTDGNWSVPANWNPAAVPGGGDNVSIAFSDGSNRTVNYDYTGPNVSLNSLTLDLTNYTGTLASVLAMSANNLTAGTEYIGNSGSGALVQSGGDNSVTNSLLLGNNANSIGTYTQSAGSLSVNGYAHVGYSGSGFFNQSGGTTSVLAGFNLIIADNANSIGNYSLSGSGSLSVAGNEYVANTGLGNFVQDSATNSLINGGSLVVGNNAAATGTYTLKNSGTLSVAGDEQIGYSGSGAFTQDSGSHSITQTLALGNNAGSTGTFTLTGTGSLTVTGTEYLGSGGVGNFIQSGGTNTGPSIILGNNAGSNGKYSLGGNGSLVANTALYLGYNGTGTFVQTGGIVSTKGAVSDGPNSHLSLILGLKAGSTGSYTLSDGTLTVAQDEMVGEASSGTFTQNGGNNTCSQIIVVGHINGGSGKYDFSAGVTQANGLLIGDYGQATGSFLLSNTASLTVTGTEGIGDNSNSKASTIASLTQSGGANNAGGLDIGNTADGSGTYTLSNGTLALSGLLSLTGDNAFFTATGGTATALTATNTGSTIAINAMQSSHGNLAVSGTYTQTAGSTIVQGILSAGGGATFSGGTLQVGAPGFPGTISANITNNAAISVLGGTLATPSQITEISGQGSLTIGSAQTGAALQLAASGGASFVGSLTINAKSSLDINNNSLIINYKSGNDPVAAIRSAIIDARNGGNWESAGLTSSLARANPSAFTIGYTDNTATDQLLIMATVPGDSNLSGSTDFTDLTAVAQNFGDSLAKGDNVSWQTGDVNYDGSVDFSDLTIVAQSFGDSLTKAEAATLPASFIAQYNLALAEGGRATSVPEPVAITFLPALAVGLLRRRRANIA